MVAGPPGSKSSDRERSPSTSEMEPPRPALNLDMEGSRLKVMAMYPFLPEASEYVREQGPPLEEILEHRAYEASRHMAIQGVRTALDTGELPDQPLSSLAEYLTTLYSYPLARILVSCVGDPFLIRRFALAQASLARRRVSREDATFLMQICHSLKLDCFIEGSYRLHFADFLRATKRLRGKEWKLINQPVQDGYVVLSRDKFLRVLEGSLRNRFEDELPLEVNDLLLESFREEVGDLKERLRHRKTHLESADLGPVRVTNFPPCMQRLLASVLASENVPHPGRFALVSFMNNLGLGFDEIYQVFASVPDFRESVTRYQIEHITGRISGTEYTSPECSTMKSYGLCPGPDNLCRRITHPLSYHRLKSRLTSKASPAESERGT